MAGEGRNISVYGVWTTAPKKIKTRSRLQKKRCKIFLFSKLKNYLIFLKKYYIIIIEMKRTILLFLTSVARLI